MLFHTAQFVVFLALSFALYWAVRSNKAARLGVLMVASLAFYAAWTPLPLLVFLYCATVDWICTRLMERTGRASLRKVLLIVAVVSDLAVLSVFKYADLFYETTASLLGHVGIAVRYEPLGLLLPVGLSFVVFQAISYTVDVYRGEVSGKRSWFEVALFLLFFPQIVAGPIVRARDLLERFDEIPRLTADQGVHALYRIATGMVKKLLIADLLATGIVDRVFANPSHYTSAECAVAAVAYTFQIYFDFSAYSDIAIGSAALFGFPLPENFRRPYLARNLFEFWNRWHISLSTWLRDYLYIPLGGNRVSRPRVLWNLMVVMVLGGLWHGADWRFAFWGLVHGVALVVIRCWWWWRGKPKDYAPLAAARGMLVTFTIVVLTRIFFRAPDMDHAWAMFGRLLALEGGLANVSTLVWAVLAIAALSHAIPLSAWTRGADLFARTPTPIRAAALVGLALVIRQVTDFEVQPYIYFQF